MPRPTAIRCLHQTCFATQYTHCQFLGLFSSSSEVFIADPEIHSKIEKESAENGRNVIYIAGPIRTLHDPSMIRPWTRHLAPARSPRLLLALWRCILYWKLQHFALRLPTSPNAAPATKSDTPTSPNAVPATKSDTPKSPNAALATKNDTATSPNIAPATKSDTATSPNVAPATKKDTPTSPRKVTFQLHQILHLPQKLTLCYLIEPLLDWAVTLLSCYFTDLLLYWTATLLSCYSTEFFAFLNLRNSEVSHLNFL